MVDLCNTRHGCYFGIAFKSRWSKDFCKKIHLFCLSGGNSSLAVLCFLKTLTEQNNDSTIKRIFAGANQSFAVSRPGEVG